MGGRKRKLGTLLEAAKAALTTFVESEKRIANPNHRDSGEAYYDLTKPASVTD